jgi:hypothetical protein
MTIFAGIELTIPATIFGSLSFAAAPFFMKKQYRNRPTLQSGALRRDSIEHSASKPRTSICG